MTALSHNAPMNPFTATTSLAANLQGVVADLVALHLQAKQAHWNLVGDNFQAIHRQLDDIVDDARQGSDSIAERMRALGATPDGRAPTVAATASLTPLPAGELSSSHAVELIVTSLFAAAGTARAVHDQVDAEDPSTADLLHGIILQLEKQAWMLSATGREPRHNLP